MVFLDVGGVFAHAASRWGLGCFGWGGSSPPPRPAQARDVSPAADVAFHLCKQGRHAVRQFSGLNRPARRCLYLRFAVRLATYHARLKVRIESLLLFCRALSSPTTCRFIPAHSHPCVALSSAEVSTSVPEKRRKTKTPENGARTTLTRFGNISP